MQKKQVLIDTNFLFIPFRFKIDVFSEIKNIIGEYEAVLSNIIVRELEGLASGSGKHAREAKLALSMLRQKNIRIVETQTPADEWIYDYAVENKAIVATNDSELAKKLKKQGIKVIVLRNKSVLEAV